MKSVGLKLLKRNSQILKEKSMNNGLTLKNKETDTDNSGNQLLSFNLKVRLKFKLTSRDLLNMFTSFQQVFELIHKKFR